MIADQTSTFRCLLLLSVLCGVRSIPCGVNATCMDPIPIGGIGSNCGAAAAALNQSLVALGSGLTALDLTSLTATYYCIPAVRTSHLGQDVKRPK